MRDSIRQGSSLSKENHLEYYMEKLSRIIDIPMHDGADCLEAFGEALEELKAYLEETECKSVHGMNMIACLASAKESMAESLSAGKVQTADDFLQYTIQPLLQHLQRDLFLWLYTYGDEDAMAEYREAQVSALKDVKEQLPKLLKREYPYDVTIAVTAYNKCEYSRLAVESILKHTDFSHFRIELILIDNGSTDDTLEFFRSVEHAKVIHLQYPLGYPATSLGAYAAHGKYYIHFANDIIATPYWLENLLSCMQALPDTGMMVPACNYMSSHQSIYAHYQDPMLGTEELDGFAAEYNEKYHNEWEERVRLLPCMSIMPSAVAKRAANDTLFHFGDFADDDVSTRLRRAGLRQIYAKGTFVHHFGSVTARHSQRYLNSLNISRELFREKWDVDAWSSWDWEYGLVEALLPCLPTKQARSLWIDPEFCELPIKVRDSFLKRTGQQLEVYGAVTDQRFLPDARGIMDGAVSGDLRQCLMQLAGKSYDAVVFRDDIGKYMEDGILQKLLAEIKPLLNPGGSVVFYSLNGEVFLPLNNLLVAAMAREHGEHLVPTVSLYPWDVAAAAEKTGFSVSILPAEKPLQSYWKDMLELMGGMNPQACNRNIFILKDRVELSAQKGE